MITSKHILYKYLDQKSVPIYNFHNLVDVKFDAWDPIETAKLIAVHPYLDIAILKLNKVPPVATPATISFTVRSGNELTVIGNEKKRMEIGIIFSPDMDR